jgi:outer membrane protein assembly factor BamB
MHYPIILTVLGVLAFFPAIAVEAADWTQWRGQERDGRVSASPSANWANEPRLVWKLEIGQGHSSPVKYGGRVFTLSRKAEEEVVSCLSFESGEILWQKTYPAPYKMDSAAYAHGKGPKSTPLVHGGRLYTFGISGIFSCFDLQSGTLLWRHDARGEFAQTSPPCGTAMSPIAAGEFVIAHLGGGDEGALRAFDGATGKVIWDWKGDGPGYASPILVNLEGVEQLVTQSQENIVGIALADGRELWRIPFSTPWRENVVTPAIHGELLVLSGLNKGIFAIRLSRSGHDWSIEEVWSRKDISLYMSSPVLHGDLLYGLSHLKRGQLFCLNARTGEVFWKGEGRQGEHAGLLVSEEMLFALNTDGEFMVIENTGEALREISVHSVADSPTWAHPVLIGSQLLVKDFSSLALWSF